MTISEKNKLKIKTVLDELYSRYNHRKFVHPDPLEFLYDYDDIRDREIAGLVASSLAYGRVAQILKGVGLVLNQMDSPYDFVIGESPRSIKKAFADFKHRFTTGDEISGMLIAVKRIIGEYGSLENCFLNGMDDDDEDIVSALKNFVAELRNGTDCSLTGYLPCPSDGSACKRWNLYLKWMIRHDKVDPGGWKIPSSILIVPLDTHMHRLSLLMGITRRKQADLKTAIEVTDFFRSLEPSDPVRYDFCLTRLGIRKDNNSLKYIELIKMKEVA